MQYSDAIASIALQNSIAGLLLMGLGAAGLFLLWLVSR